MDRQLLLRDMMREELVRYKKLYDKMENEFRDLAEGAIIEQDGRLNRVFRENGKQKWIRIYDKSVLCELKKRRYIKKAMPVLAKRIKKCIRFLENDSIYDPEEIAMDLPEQYQGFDGLGVVLDGDVEVTGWNLDEYTKGEMYKQHLIHEVENGLVTRSKSETMIAMRLKERGFDFRYEPELDLKGKKMFPDFGALLKKRRRIVYWEHLGMIDDIGYVRAALKKLETYSDNGIILGHNLVITFETKDNPLTLREIDRIIDKLIKMDEISVYF